MFCYRYKFTPLITLCTQFTCYNDDYNKNAVNESVKKLDAL